MTEFELIKNYFATQTLRRPDVVLGIGDDAAIVNVPATYQIVTTTDTLVAGVHFLPSTLPFDLGYKALAVNLSDLAAMGARPTWATLAITLPTADETWIQQFCDGFFTLANKEKVQLIGGDLTHGPLSITVQALGTLPPRKALLRSGAKPNDLIYVTGTLGDAGLALKSLHNQVELKANDKSFLLTRLNRPDTRVAAGEKLRDLATSTIDISDGLTADLNHILKASHVGAQITVDHLPLSAELKHSVSIEEAFTLALTAGDDYELCFTIPAEKQKELEKSLSQLPYRFTQIGHITAEAGLKLHYEDGREYHGQLDGYQHF